YRLTPRYDILSAHTELGHGRGKLAPEKIRMAMAAQGKNRQYRWKEIQARHWVETGKRCGFSGMKLVLEDLIARTPRVLDQVRGALPAGFPEDIANAILEGTQCSAQQLTKELASVAN
ncbi:MAG: type II toxin-antitoxin system HipA family toxin, partial [Limisphaerales bacterium]